MQGRLVPEWVMCVPVCVCVIRLWMCVCLLSSLGEEDEQRAKVAAHEAALKVIKVIRAQGSSSSFPLPTSHWMRCTCTSNMGRYTVNSRLITWPCFFYSFPAFQHCLKKIHSRCIPFLLITREDFWALQQRLNTLTHNWLSRSLPCLCLCNDYVIRYGVEITQLRVKHIRFKYTKRCVCSTKTWARNTWHLATRVTDSGSRCSHTHIIQGLHGGCCKDTT